ncbi:patatin-like phospholipase family protein [Salipiger abyssi]|uniref:patatin-like phospholipase family protein n=1 Tax=Salipiger abyssi TaxID=1250539 RepID=UPI001A8EE10E|nr:patatin-like phospholipase family protein [Salipiger abyssi]MBN9890218.1 patatin-like phospholipase family protein [Salipiger abyssi]
MARIGLALGSGGARGWSHIGVLRALEKAGIRPDVVAGTSMGALVGAAYCSRALDRLEDFARSMTPLSMARMIDLDLRAGGLVAGNTVLRTLKTLGLSGNFADLDRPFIAVTTDLYRGRELWLRDGALLPAVRASTAIPGIFSPVRHDNRWLMDGGMSNPVPVSACRALGADIVIAVDPNAGNLASHGSVSRRSLLPQVNAEALIGQLPRQLQPAAAAYFVSGRDPASQPPGYIEVLSTALDVMIDQICRSRLAGDPPNVMVDLNLSHLNVLAFHEAETAIEQGYAAMKDHLPRVLAERRTFS